MTATITTRAILFSWALEANLKWNTNVLAEWLDMDLNRKRKRKHYFQYGQVAEEGSSTGKGGPQRPVQWAHESRSPCPVSSGKEAARVEAWTRTKRSSDVHVLTGLKRKLHTKCVYVAQKPQKLHRHRGSSARQAGWERDGEGDKGEGSSDWAIFLLDITINLK